MRRETREFLQRVRAIISDPSHWTQGALARGADGKSANVTDRATCWCLVGAFYATAEEGGVDFFFIEEAMFAVSCRLPDSSISISNYNDTHEHADVIALLDRAIAS